MKTLKRTRYYTMNSWNLTKSLAYNLKVYNVVDEDLQDKVFELMESEDFYDDINWLIRGFDRKFNHKWQAGFNGRSGGYLVLYFGGVRTKYINQEMFREGRAYISDGHGWMSLAEAIKADILNREIVTSVYTQPGYEIEEDEVPADVKRAFRQLAVDIVKNVEYKARNFHLEEEEYQVTNTRKVLRES